MTAEEAGEKGETVNLSLEETLTLAREAVREGHLDWAEAIFRSVLKVLPDHSEATHFLGVILHKKGHRDEALHTIEKSLALEKDNAGFWNNYGLALRAGGRLDDAVDAFKRSVELDPRHADAFNNLGLLQRQRHNVDLADACFSKAIEINPVFVEAYNNLAALRMRQNRLPEAVQLSFKAVTLQPQNFESKRLLGYAYAEIGEFEKAREVYKEWLENEPDNPIAQHHYNALSGDAPERASDDYVRQVFDGFADSFDEKLASLEYRAPEIVIEAVKTVLGDPKGGLQIADLGCGTGLCGPGLRPYAAYLAGVDLSKAMVDKARVRNCYDALVVEELMAYCHDHPHHFDVITCADTLCYFGDLAKPFGAMAGAMKPGGIAVFTVEAADDEPNGYVLHHHGRYSHTRSYVRDSLALNQLSIDSALDVVLRYESGHPVHGLVMQVRL
ncbi:MAG: tetratricopeptide repeat protein [Beijerinckiaceae bacterium]